MANWASWVEGKIRNSVLESRFRKKRFRQRDGKSVDLNDLRLNGIQFVFHESKRTQASVCFAGRIEVNTFFI